MASEESKGPELHKLQQSLADLQQDKLVKDDVLFEMEQRQLGLETENSELKAEISKAIKREKAVGEQVGVLTAEQAKLRLQLNEKSVKLSDLEVRCASLETAKGRLEEQLQEQIEEADRNRRDAEKQTAKAVSLSGELSKCEDTNSNLHAENLRLKYACDQAIKEKELMQKHQQWLDSEVTLRSSELREVRESKSSQVLGLEREVNELQERNSVLEAQSESIREESSAKSAQVAEHLKTIRMLEINHANQVEQIQMELEKQTKLVALYKKTNEQEREKTTDVYKSAEQIARDLAQEKQKLEASLMETQRIEHALDECTREKDRLFSELQAEREKKKVLLLSNDDDSIRSAYSSSPPDSPQHDLAVPQWSYMELFSKYQLAIEESRKSKRECHDLEAYVKQTKLESDDKGPMLESQRFQYNRILQAHKQVTTRLNETKRAFEQSEEKLAIAHKELQDMEREQEVMRTENSDLSRQVLSLLKASGHGVSSLALLATDKRVNGLAAPGDLIAESLVEVSSVEDMQEQNRKQLAVIRQFHKQYNELTAEKDKWVDERTQIRTEAQELKKALDALKDERSRQELRLDALQQSLNLGQALEDDEGSLVDDMDDDASVASVGKRRRLGAYQKSLQSALEGKNNDLVRQLAEANEKDVAFRKAQRESLAEMQTTIDQLRLEASKCRAELAQANAESKWQKETHQVYVQNTQATEKERAREKTKLSALMSSLTEHQTRLQSANTEVQTLRQQFEKASKELSNAQAELELNKKGEARLLVENEKLLLEVRRQETLLGHLRDLQNALKAQDQGALKRLTVEKEELRVECKNLKSELDAERREKRDASKLSSAKTDQLQARLDQVEPLYHEAEKELAALRVKCEDALSRLTEAQKSLDTQKEQVEILLKMKGGAKLDLTNPKLAHLGEDSKLQKTLTDALGENARLSETLAQAQEQNAALKSFGETTERDLKLLTQSSKEFQSKSEETVARITGDNTALRTRLDELSAKLTQYEGDEGKVRLDLEKRVAELSALLEATTEDKKQVEAGVLQWQQQRAKLLEDIRTHAELAAQAQNEREQEVLAHAADVSRLAQVKQEFELLDKRVKAAESEAKVVWGQLETSEASWSRQKTEFETQIQRLETKLDDANKHAEVLLSQLDSVTLHSKRLTDNTLAQDSSPPLSSEINEEVEKLNKILRYVRTEREVAVAEREQAQQELLKLQYTLQRLEGTLKDERAQREQAALADSTTKVTKESHAKVMEQLTQLNLFRESNTLLREEHSLNLNKLTSLEAKLKEVEAELAPLHATIRRLEADKVTLQADCKSLEVECSRWKQRNQQLLDKYQTVDMDEYKRMQVECAKVLEAQKTAAENFQKENLDSKAEIERLQKLFNSQKTANEALTNKNNRLEASIKKQAETPPPTLPPPPQPANQTTSKLTAMLGAARVVINARVAELETARKSLEVAKGEVAAAKTELEALKVSSATLKAQLEFAQGDRAKLQAAARAFEGERAAHAQTIQNLALLEAERSSFQKNETAAVDIQTEKERLQREMDAKLDVQKSLLQKATSDALLSENKMAALQAEIKDLKKLSLSTQTESQRHAKAERTAIQAQLEAKTILADKTKELEKAQAEIRRGVAENTDLKQTKLALQQQVASLSEQLTKLQASALVASPMLKSPTPATLETPPAPFLAFVPSPVSSTPVLPASPLPAQAAKRKGPTSTPPVAKKSIVPAGKTQSPPGPVSAFPPSGAVKLKRTLEEMTPSIEFPFTSPPVTHTIHTEPTFVFGDLAPSFPVFASPVMAPSSAPHGPSETPSLSLLHEPIILTSAFGQSLLSSTSSAAPPSLPLPMLADVFSQPPLAMGGMTPLFGLRKEERTDSFHSLATEPLEEFNEPEEKTAPPNADVTEEPAHKEADTPVLSPEEEDEQLDLSLEGDDEPLASATPNALKGAEEESLPVIESTVNMEEEEIEGGNAADAESQEAAPEQDAEGGGDAHSQQGDEHEQEEEEEEQNGSGNTQGQEEQSDATQPQQDSLLTIPPSSSRGEAEVVLDEQAGSGDLEEASVAEEQEERVEPNVADEESTGNSQEMQGHSSSELLSSVEQDNSTVERGNDNENQGNNSGMFDEEEAIESVRENESVDESSTSSGSGSASSGSREEMYGGGGEMEENMESHVEPEIVPDVTQEDLQDQGSQQKGKEHTAGLTDDVF